MRKTRFRDQPFGRRNNQQTQSLDGDTEKTSQVVDERIDLSRCANDNVTVTDVRRRGETITRIVNIYDQKDTQSGERERPARKLKWQRVMRQGSTVLAGDFNAHSSRWDPECQVQRNAMLWKDVIDENGLEIGNDGRATHHWTRKGHEGESVIDLTLANRPITQGAVQAHDYTTGSDHEVIEWDVEADRQELADLERVVGWNVAAMTEKDAEADAKLWLELAKRERT